MKLESIPRSPTHASDQKGFVSGLKTLIGIAFFSSLLLGGGIGFWANSPADLPAAEATVLVQNGRSALSVLQELETARVIPSARALHWLGRLTRQWPRMKIGEYKIQSTLTPWQVTERLTSGESIRHSLTLREGQNMFELAESLDKMGFHPKQTYLERFRSEIWRKKVGVGSAPSIEGYLFPDTYLLTRVMTPDEVIDVFTRRFQQAWLPEWRIRAQELGRSQYEIVILASMIEKETGATKERPRISSVFHNRLKKGMPLQSDPTTIYGIWERWTGNLKRSDLQEKTPWNTYAIPALPLGPIGNPGSAAIDAALHPAQSEALYFVSKNDGTHEFTNTYEDHLAAVRRYQLNARAREGKSWRDLKQD